MGGLLGPLSSLSPIWMLTAAIVVAIVIYVVHDRSFFLTDLFYKFPLIGKLRLYSRDYSKHSRADWLNVEMRLCRDYRPHVTAISREQFNNDVTYLKKTYDDARQPMPFWAMIGLGILIALEGLGFAYLLGSIIAFEGSENIRTVLMIAVTIVLSLILFVVNHNAGHELFRWKLLSSCFRSFQMEGNARFSSRSISLDQDQSIDDDEPPHTQCANRVITRVDDQGSLLWLIIALTLTVVIAVGSTILRDATMHVAELETAPKFFQLFADDNAKSAVQNLGEDELKVARRAAAWMGFIILAVLFIVTQFVGIEVGRRWGFAGRQSKKAYLATHGCADYDTYYEPVQRRINIASARLETLQQLLERRSPNPLPFHKTFIDFIREERDRGATDLQEPGNGRSEVAEPPQLALPPPEPQDTGQDNPRDAAGAGRGGFVRRLFGRRHRDRGSE